MNDWIHKESLTHAPAFVSSPFPEAVLARSHVERLSRSPPVVLVFKE